MSARGPRTSLGDHSGQVEDDISFLHPTHRQVRVRAASFVRRTVRSLGYNFAWCAVLAIALVVGLLNILHPTLIGEMGFHRPNTQPVRLQEVASDDQKSPYTANLASPSLLYMGGTGYSAPYRSSDGSPNFVGVGGSTPVLSLLPVQQGAILGTSSPLTIAASANTREGIITYIVQEGDNPSVVAASFGITLNTLLWANDLRDGQYIHPGDELTILPIPGVRYKVRSGDTLSTIANRFKGDVQEIIAFNSLSGDGAIYQGDYVIIPHGEMPRGVYSPSYNYSYAGKDLGGYFIRPASGRISQYLHPYNAIDISNACWTPIYAAAEGEVDIADGYGWNGGYGQYVRIQHPNGVETVYAHAIKLAVKAGEYVAQGQLISYMGSTGRSTGCHVHWEVWGGKESIGIKY